MTYHDDNASKTKTSRRGKVIPPHKRKVVSDCEPGDVVQFDDGSIATVTAWLNNGPMGRHHDENEKEGEFVPIEGSLPIVRLRGYK